MQNTKSSKASREFWAKIRREDHIADLAGEGQELCPYTVGKRICVTGAKGHAGAHNWV